MKKFFNKHTVTAFLLLAVILFTTVATLADYKKNHIIELPGSYTQLRSMTETIFNDNLYGFDNYIGLYSVTQKFLGLRVYDDETFGLVMMDDHGKLHFPVGEAKDTDIERWASSVADLNEKVGQSGAPFLYIQLPCKLMDGVSELPPGGYHYGNRNTDRFLGYLSEKEVDYEDLRETVKNSADYDELFYRTDHHWTTSAAFFTFGEIVELLNEKYGLALDPDGFCRNEANWVKTEYPSSYLGSQGKRIGKAVAGLDDYTLYEPGFEVSFEVYDAGTYNPEPVLIGSGSLRESMVHEPFLACQDLTENKHAAYFQFDYGHLILKNKTVDNDVKLFVIKDSFSLPLVAFLSTCVSEIHMVDVRDGGAPNVSDVLKANDFDAVLLIYNAGINGDAPFAFDKPEAE